MGRTISDSEFGAKNDQHAVEYRLNLAEKSHLNGVNGRVRICVAVKGDRFASLAASYAAATGAQLVWFDAAEQPFSPALPQGEEITLVFIASPETCKKFGVRNLLRTDGDTGAGLLSVGILTASSHARLADLFDRLLTRTPAQLTHLHVFEADGLHSPFAPIPGPTFSQVGLKDRNDLSRLTTTEMQVAHFRGHGRSYCAMDGFLCSRRSTASVGDADCVAGMTCVFDQVERIPASQINCDIALIESCSTARFDTPVGEAGEYENLAVQMLDGKVTSVFCTDNYGPVLPFTSHLIWSALRTQRFTAARLCSLLNSYFKSKTAVAGSFILFGDPDTELFIPESKAALPWARTSADAMRVESLPSGIHLKPFPATNGVPLFFDADHPNVAVDQFLFDDVQYALIINEAPSPVSVEISFGEKADQTFAPDSAVALAALPVTPSNLSEPVDRAIRQLATFRDRGARLSIPGKVEAHHDALVWRSYEVIKRIVAHSVSTAVTQECVEAAELELYELYGIRDEVSAKRLVTPHAECPRCRAPSLAYHYEVLRPSIVQRLLRECSQCGAIVDTNAVTAFSTIEAPAQIKPGNACDIEMVGTNLSNFPRSIHAKLVIGTLGGLRPAYTSSAVHLDRIDPLGTFSISVHLEVLADSDRQVFWANVIVLSDLHLSSILFPLAIR